MSSTVQVVFREHFRAYAATRRLPFHHHRAAHLIGACRSAALGGHIQGCPEGHVQRVHYNACRHRLCPQCGALARERWLQAECARLLPCGHHHVIFTVPHQLNALWRFNHKGFAEVLFDTVAETLRTLLGDPRYLDAQAGWLLALHSWTRSLALHPHIHALISDGGLSDGIWLAPRRSHFLPARVVMALFRGKLLARLRALIDAQLLKLPADLSIERARSLINKLGRAKWNVRVCPRYAYGEGVVRYLARYVRGGPLKNSQLTRVSETEVAFRYRPHAGAPGAPALAYLHLSPQAFLERYLSHTPVPGQHQVRRYGLYAPARRAAREQARSLLVPRASAGEPTAPGPAPSVLTWQGFLARFARPVAALTCPVCGRAIAWLQRLVPVRAPPPAHAH